MRCTCETCKSHDAAEGNRRRSVGDTARSRAIVAAALALAELLGGGASEAEIEHAAVHLVAYDRSGRIAEAVSDALRAKRGEI